MKTAESTSSPRWRWGAIVVFAMLLLGTWLAFLSSRAFGAVSPLVFFFGCLYYGVKKQLVTVILFVVLSPLGFYFGKGALDYFSGTGQIITAGLPGAMFSNLDRELRLTRVTTGCVVDGHEWMREIPYNASLRLLIAVLGYMPGAYSGPYPTRDEAVEAAMAGAVLEPGQLAADVFAVEGVDVELKSGLGQALLDLAAGELELIWSDHDPEPPTAVSSQPIRAAIYQEECLVLLLPAIHEVSEPEGALLVLVDRGSGLPFCYLAEGGFYMADPPHRWLAYCLNGCERCMNPELIGHPQRCLGSPYH